MTTNATSVEFSEDLSISLHLRLQVGDITFSKRDLKFIESWDGDHDNGTFYDRRITKAYGLSQAPGNEPGEYTWPQLAAFLRDKQKVKGLRIGDQNTAPRNLSAEISRIYLDFIMGAGKVCMKSKEDMPDQAKSLFTAASAYLNGSGTLEALNACSMKLGKRGIIFADIRTRLVSKPYDL